MFYQESALTSSPATETHFHPDSHFPERVFFFSFLFLIRSSSSCEIFLTGGHCSEVRRKEGRRRIGRNEKIREKKEMSPGKKTTTEEQEEVGRRRRTTTSRSTKKKKKGIEMKEENEQEKQQKKETEEEEIFGILK